MIKRKRIELEKTNSILDLILDEKNKILFVKKETIDKNISKVKGYGELLSKQDIKFSNLKMPEPRKGYTVRFQYEYNIDDINNSKLGYITIYDQKGNIYSQEYILDCSSIITVEEGKKIITGVVPITELKVKDELNNIVGNNINKIYKNHPNNKVKKKTKLKLL